MHLDQIWGNDEKYSKEVQIAMREHWIKQQKQWEEDRKKRQQRDAERIAKLPPEQRPGYLTEQAKIKLARGELTNPFIEKWLEGEIVAARTMLFVGMALTALFKGQIVIWVIMYIAYKARVKRAKEEALEANRKQYE
jgi:hypothetical protein